MRWFSSFIDKNCLTEYAMWPVGAETSDSVFKATIWSLRNACLCGLIIITYQTKRLLEKWWYPMPYNEREIAASCFCRIQRHYLGQDPAGSNCLTQRQSALFWPG